MMKRVSTIFLIVLSIIFAPVAQAQVYWNGTVDKKFAGSGTQADPYLISTPEQLAGLAERTNTDKEDFAGQYIKLTADIYLTDFTNPDTTTWLEWNPIGYKLMQYDKPTDYGYFRGNFDGDGHTIYNLYYGSGMNWADDWDPNDFELELNAYDWSVMNKALFVNVDGGTIENVRMANAKMAGVNQALLVLHAGTGSTIRNCHVEGELRGTQSSCNGLVYTNNGLIENCSAIVSTNLQGGGAFVHTNEVNGVIRNCTSAGTMRCTMSGGAGFVFTNNGLIEQCTSSVSIQALGGPDAQINEVGGHTFRYRDGAGFVLENHGTIRECAAFGDVAGEGTSINYVWRTAIAGFAYRNWNGRIESCYCTGALRDVSDSTGVGGDPTIATFCYNNGEDAMHSSDDNHRGDIFNCYTTSTVRHHDADYYRNSIHAFLGSTHGNGGFTDMGYVEPSRQLGCYFSNEGLPVISGQSGAVWGGIGKPLAQMKTQAFVNELNKLAAIMGLSQWELRDGLPRPTGVYVTNTALLFGGGEGTQANPYIIATKEHLDNFAWLVNQGADFYGQYIKQTADIALNPPFVEWEEEAPTPWTPIAFPRIHAWYSLQISNEFRGEYDGDFHKVENMWVNSAEDRNQGLFGTLGKGAVLRNLHVTDAYIRANGNVGVLAGYMGESGRIIQCYTSGDVAWKSENGANIGAMIGDLGSYTMMLNCASSAKLSGGGAYNGIGIKHGSQAHVWAQDTCINFLFAGNINNGERCIQPIAGSQYNENVFVDRTKHAETGCGTDAYHLKEPTEWIQSQALVNLYNYAVSRWNTRHTEDDALQLNYWQYNENDYPSIADNKDWRPAVAITFHTNGGEPVATKYVCANSEALPPQRPLREGYLFAGWYKDAGLTQFYDWKTERPTSSLTLYARWIEDNRWEIDITPFQNEFAKTYHIKTAAQLRGFAALQNGLYDWGEKNDCGGSSNVLKYPADPVSQTLTPMSFRGKKVVLDNDILLCDTTDWQYWGRGAFGLPWKPISSDYGVTNEGDHTFYGTFDGCGHTIYGMYIENTGMPNANSNAGLFSTIGDSSVIRNVGIAASCIDMQSYDTRGITGDATKYWLQCGVGTQGAAGRAGMLVGYAVNAFTIDQCYTEGNIFVQSGGFYGLGGMIGQAGDVFYYNKARITNSYSRVDVHNTSMVDTIDYMPCDYGFATLGKQIPIETCYSAGHTYHSFANANNSYGDSVLNCYYDKELVQVMDHYSWGGKQHYIGDPKTTNEMHAKATYTDWDFENIWGRNDTINDGYPYLRCFYDSIIPDSPDPYFTVTFQDWDGAVLKTEQVEQGKSATAPADPTREGYTFKGWDRDFSNVQSDLTVTALYERNAVEPPTPDGSITVRLDPQSCSSWSRVYLYAWDNNQQQPAGGWPGTKVSKDNDGWWSYTFDSKLTKVNIIWTNGSGDQTIDITGVTVSTCYKLNATTGNKITVTVVDCPADVQPVYFTVTFQDWDGTVHKTEQVEQGKSATAPADPTREGYTFKGWDRDFSNVQSDLTVTAQYDKNIVYFTVTFQDWDGAVLKTEQVEQGKSATAPASPTREGYTFKGWDKDFSNVQSDLTVTAQYTRDIVYFTVSFYDWDGTELHVEQVEQGKDAVGPAVNPTREGYTFVGWSKPITNIQSNLIVIAQYKENAVYFTVNFIDWDGTLLKSEEVEKGKSATAPAAPAREGYTFKGWDKDFSNVQSDLTVTALYEQNVVEPTYFTVTFQDWDGTVLKTEQVEQGRSATAPADPTREGYTFKGWDKDFSNVQSDLTVTAQYTRDIVYFTVSFYDWDGTELHVEQVEQGKDAVGPAVNPTREGYTFVGWSKPITNIQSNLIVIAQYKENAVYFTVNFIDWDGTLLKSEEVEKGKSATAPAAPAREGYTFKGWDKDFSNVQSDLTVTAQYEQNAPDPIYYTVIFQDWDGTTLKTEQVEQGKSATAPATPVREGYTFKGWDKDFSNVQSDLTVTAQYEQNAPEPIYYTVTFQDWDGSILKNEQVEQGKSATAPAAPVREGYTFIGWDKDFSNVQSDLTVTAQYEQNAQNDAITVRLNPSSAPTWSNVYLYSWYDGGAVQPCGAWPGLQVSKDSNGWWSYTFDSNVKSVNIIWNNGTGEQTIDITDVTQSTCYDLDTDVYPYGVFVIDCSKNPTALEDVQSNSTPKAHKVIKNNTLYIILPDGSKYSATGQKL